MTNVYCQIDSHFAFVRSRRKNPGPILIDNNGTVEHDPSRAAEVFGNDFSGLTVDSSEESCSFIEENDIHNIIPYLQLVDISDDDVSQVIKNLQSDKSPGPDNITPKLLKLCSPSITPVLRIKTVNSLSSPVHKSGDTSALSNYRPIALTSGVCKMMETLIANAIQCHTLDYCLLNAKPATRLC